MKSLIRKLEFLPGILIIKCYIYRHIIRILFLGFPLILFMYYYFKSNNIENVTYILLYFSTLMILFMYSEFFRLVFTIEILTFSFTKNGTDLKQLSQSFKEPNSKIIYINHKYPYEYNHEDLAKIQRR